LLDEFVFVLDGDAREVEPAIAKAASKHNRYVKQGCPIKLSD
jgi:hypothetical protein